MIDATVTDAGRVRHVFRTVGYGSSFGGNPLEQHIGVGSATLVKEVVVTWPATGVVDRVRGMAVDRRYTLREGEGSAPRGGAACRRLSGDETAGVSGGGVTLYWICD